jgi:hypothetical protein
MITTALICDAVWCGRDVPPFEIIPLPGRREVVITPPDYTLETTAFFMKISV